jgi:hypothetical protein
MDSLHVHPDFLDSLNAQIPLVDLVPVDNITYHKHQDKEKEKEDWYQWEEEHVHDDYSDCLD